MKIIPPSKESVKIPSWQRSTVKRDGVAGVEVSQQGSVCEVKRLGMVPVGGGRRGKASVFGSLKSAARYRRRVKKMDYAKIADDFFVPMLTLTWGGGLSFIPQAAEIWVKALDKFERRFRRKFPQVGAVWAWENQDKRTAKMPGTWFPHTHIIPFFENKKWHMSCRYLELIAWLRETWAACIWEYLSDADREMVGHCNGLTNVERKIGGDVKKQLLYLVSYIGKQKTAGGGLPSHYDGAGGADCGLVLDTGTYQAVGGRPWGLWNAGSIPWAEKFTCTMFFGRWFYGLRRASIRFYPALMSSKAMKYHPGAPVGGDGPPGYTLESCSDLRWFLYALQLAGKSA
jgi:hypothetical protein